MTEEDSPRASSEEQFSDTRPLKPVTWPAPAPNAVDDARPTQPDRQNIDDQFADTRPLQPISPATLAAMADLAVNETPGDEPLTGDTAGDDEDPHFRDTRPLPSPAALAQAAGLGQPAQFADTGPIPAVAAEATPAEIVADLEAYLASDQPFESE